MIRDLYELPPDLPVPLDDGGTDHLMGLKIPPLYLESTSGGKISLEKALDGRVALFTDHLHLPTFVFEGERLIKRMALYIEDRFIKKVFYPVFPPNQNAQEVLDWVRTLPKTSN